MSKEKQEKNERSTGIRKNRVLFWALGFLLILDIAVRLYFLQGDLVTRNIDRGIGSLPYLFSQMDRHDGEKIAWVGSSVLQGYQNVSAGRTFPALVEKQLRKSGDYENPKCFNLASAGHNFGDHYAIFSEALRHNPDLIVVAVHFKSFSQNASTSVPMQHKQLAAYIHGDPNRAKLLKLFDVSRTEYYTSRIDQAMGFLSGFYRYRRLISEMASESADPPAFYIADKFKESQGLKRDAKSVARDEDPEERATDYLWKLLPDSLIGHNHEICSTLDFSDSNRIWRIFKELSAMAEEKNANVLFYLTPINDAMVEQFGLFDLNLLRNYKQAAGIAIRKKGHLLADATNKVDPAFFSDTDHLNMNGHAQLAIFLTDYVEKGLKRTH